MNIKPLTLIGLVVIGLTANAIAQGVPAVGNKPILQGKPKAPSGCKLVGTVKGTKIWAGECTDAAESNGTAPAAEAAPLIPLSERAAGAIPPGKKP